ncbi:hypothetical protein C8A01DRAFT_16088 [Parachaetomium inaequale]|uniref:Heterokaryon incompatibility domain-containing protein n=1 Tax=Parachaetomium inaequale TaxID=2588326 RepID=A0AAN6PG67_9PEZI|nr:hypothetical protein C8A01DRAFT_16088 [Parachaetomium inaequale]
MRLLHTTQIKLIEIYGQHVPPYAVLSHTWGDEEVTLQDLLELSRGHGQWTDSLVLSMQRFDKIRKCAEVARRENMQYIWIDTCCIDKTSSADLSEAINSMYRWYHEAEICYAYLCDVSPASAEGMFDTNSSFRLSRWFTRGWTLQELIASREVHFFARDWSYLGSKQKSNNFTELLNSITGVHRDVLSGVLAPADISIASRMRWAAFRKTTRVEDIAYCLLGIFDVNMPLLYGEGKSAFIRLQEAILLKDDDQSLFAWHSGPQDEAQESAAASSSRLWGLLAESPDQFWDAGDLNYAMPLNFVGSPAAVTSKGLRVDLCLRECSEPAGADYAVTLSCEKVFARVLAEIPSFERPEHYSSDLDQPGFYETVFVRQQPASGLPLIRISPAKEPFLAMPSNAQMVPWNIKGVHPRTIWNERSQCLETRDFNVGHAIGVFRLAIGEAENARAMDLAVGMHISNHRSCRSWCHLMPPSSLDQKLEDLFDDVNQGRRAVPDIQYEAVSAQVASDGELSVTAAVSEGYGHRSLAVSLHVFSRGGLPSHTAPKSLPLAHFSPEGNDIRNIWWAAVIGEKFVVDALPGAITSVAELRGDKNYKGHQEYADTAAQHAVERLLAGITIADSLEVSVFQRVKSAGKVRVAPGFTRSPTGTPIESLPEYCERAIPGIYDDSWNLARACFNGESNDIFAMITNEGFDDNDEADSFLQFWPLHWAVLGGYLAAVSVLLDKADPLRSSTRRFTPLHLAALLGRADILRCLVKAIGDVDKRNQNGTIKLQDCPMHLAAAHATNASFWEKAENSGTLSEFLFADFTYNALGETPLHRAAAMGNVRATRYILDHCTSANSADARALMNVNALDHRGRTPLWHAACTDSREVVKMLLDAGAFANLAGDEGLTPIHVACREGQAQSLAALLEGGANPNLLAPDVPLLPSHIACIFGHAPCLKLLLEHSAETTTALVNDVPAEDESHEMRFDALHLAIASMQIRCAKVLWSYRQPEFNGWSTCIVFERDKAVLRRKWVTTSADVWWAHDAPPPPGVSVTATDPLGGHAKIVDALKKAGPWESSAQQLQLNTTKPDLLALGPSPPRFLP